MTMVSENDYDNDSASFPTAMTITTVADNDIDNDGAHFPTKMMIATVSYNDLDKSITVLTTMLTNAFR